MRKFVSLILILVLGLNPLSLTFSSAKAYADYAICNGTGINALYSIGVQEDNSSSRKYRGWFKIKPGKCELVWKGNAKGKTFYTLGLSEDFKTGIEFGKEPGCIISPEDAAWFTTSPDCSKPDEVKFNNFYALTAPERHRAVTISREELPKVDVPRSEMERILGLNKGIDGGTLLGFGIGALLLLGLYSESERREDQRACMRACRDSREICVQLCTSR